MRWLHSVIGSLTVLTILGCAVYAPTHPADLAPQTVDPDVAVVQRAEAKRDAERRKRQAAEDAKKPQCVRYEEQFYGYDDCPHLTSNFTACTGKRLVCVEWSRP